MAKFAQIFRESFGVRAAACAVAASFALTSIPTLVHAADARQTKSGAAAATDDAQLKSRVEALEEQLVDMQVVIGTLQSLAKTGGVAAAPFPSAGSGADTARIDSLETQVRALTAQVQQLSDQIRGMGGIPSHRSEIPSSTDTASLGTGNGVPQTEPSSVPGFGSTTVSSGSGGNDAIGGLLNNEQPPAGGVSTAALPAAGEPPTGDPKQAYETAYGYLLQRDYASAESAFTDFLQKYPNDSLSGNAEYWLGETYFVRGQYKAAAGAFLKGYQTYAQSGKAADSLLKLAMSLDRLGQKDAACSSFAELSAKFPTAPQSVKARAQSERQRVGCQ